MAGMNPAFAAAIARRNAKSKKGGKPNPFAKGKGDGEGPADVKADLTNNDDAMPMKGKGKMPMAKGGLPQFLKK